MEIGNLKIRVRGERTDDPLLSQLLQWGELLKLGLSPEGELKVTSSGKKLLIPRGEVFIITKHGRILRPREVRTFLREGPTHGAFFIDIKRYMKFIIVKHWVSLTKREVSVWVVK